MPRTAESARGFGAALAIALAGTLVAGIVGAGRFVPTARAAPPTNQAGAGDRAQGEGVSFAGRVIEPKVGVSSFCSPNKMN